MRNYNLAISQIAGPELMPINNLLVRADFKKFSGKCLSRQVLPETPDQLEKPDAAVHWQGQINDLILKSSSVV